ncbi:TspO/MBR family protein [Microbacterium fluvii]|uniref:TspO/MBR family protein n=1 Tax=Microbacterium fluvii TaxID=415215 RepID=A0ABW2HD67_9MICO|nr:TspO/MBR family protein [Microbacterium fluvii]MCU4671022.1 tryptophan-rich sensory protein [Microbacterium fluvii]
MRASDAVRQAAVVLATIAMIVLAMIGTGLFGGVRVQDLQQGALDADATVLAPGRPAFAIWTVIYLGLIAYALWQALPSQRESVRHRAVGWWVAASCLFNGAWLVLAQETTLALTVLGIIGLLIVLCVLFRIAVATRSRSDGFVDALLIDGVTGLHLGWVTLATVANITAWLATLIDPGGSAELIGCLVLAAVGLIGVALGWTSGWRLAPALAIAWGLSWVAVERLSGEPASTSVGITAAVVAAVVLVPTLVIRLLKLLRSNTD